MKMDGIFIFFFTLHFLCLKGQVQFVNSRCGFPGLPFRGNITPYKNEFEINEIINYVCEVGYDILGPISNHCDLNANWKVQTPPLCRRNFAFGGSASASAVVGNFDAEDAIDGDNKTCAKIKNDIHYGKRWWTVNFGQPVNVEEVYIFANTHNKHYNLTIAVGERGNNFRKCATIIYTAYDGDSLIRKVPCPEYGTSLLIADQRLPPAQGIELCEISVYSKPEIVCGEPDRNPNCLYKNVSGPLFQQIEYYAEPGYSISLGELTRSCVKGRWVPPKIPYCPRYIIPSDPGKPPTGGNVNGQNSTQNVRSNFIVGVAIGVTAASVSTIVVIVVVVVIMRKYYKRGNSQTTVSDADGIFLHVNPSSIGSGSPTIQPTYSRPWDDPSLHMYEYIYSDTLPHRPQQSTIARQKTDGELVNIDKAGYLAHRNSSKRQWTNSGERNTRRSLLDSPAPPQGNMTISSNSSTLPQGRVTSCYNELEVDAYGYTEPEDSCHV